MTLAGKRWRRVEACRGMATPSRPFIKVAVEEVLCRMRLRGRWKVVGDCYVSVNETQGCLCVY